MSASEIVRIIEENGPLTIRELSELLGTRPEALAPIVGKLAKKGVLKKERARRMYPERFYEYSRREHVFYKPLG
ncbi:MarR family transcriptional regulator [Pyrococcus kukulkanii]|uniref:MarR family transcriptional regulator n=1 Tax=Pyrococcus kukulkanii TaxID=1609559 RepID=A0ABV4T666_9EURY